MQTSARRAISHPSLDRSDRPDVPLHIKNLVDALELDPSLSMGTFAARPANPGYARYFYWATDSQLLFFWDGSTWYGVGSQDVLPISTINAKGDLLVGLSDNVVGRLGLGSNNYVLTADNAQPSGMKWALNAVVDLASAKGDLIVATGPDALTNVPVGANGTTPIADSAQTAGVRWGSPVLPADSVFCSVDVAMTNANQFYDPTSVAFTLPAGTYMLSGHVSIVRGGNAGKALAKIWDGAAAVYGAIEGNTRGSNNGDATCFTIPPCKAVLGSTTTVKLSAVVDATTHTIKAAGTTNSPGNFVTGLSYIKVA